MIRSDMSLEEKLEEARRVQQLLGGFYIAGGYLRDIVHNAQPKDIDVWISSGGSSMDDMRQYASVLLGRVGQTLDFSGHQGDYPVGDMVVFKSTGASEDVEPVDIIFYNGTTRWQSVVNRFDFGICKYILDTRGTLHSPHEDEIFSASMNNTMDRYKVAQHAIRIHRKHPWWKPRFKFNDENEMATLRFCHTLGLYNEVTNGNTGEILSAQTEGPARNTVGLTSREAAIRAVYEHAASLQRDQVSSTAGVSTRFLDGGWTSSPFVRRG